MVTTRIFWQKSRHTLCDQKCTFRRKLLIMNYSFEKKANWCFFMKPLMGIRHRCPTSQVPAHTSVMSWSLLVSPENPELQRGQDSAPWAQGSSSSLLRLVFSLLLPTNPPSHLPLLYSRPSRTGSLATSHSDEAISSFIIPKDS